MLYNSSIHFIKKLATIKVASFLISYIFVCFTFTVTIFFAWYIHPLFSLVSFVPFFHSIENEKYKKWQRHLLIFSLFFMYNIAITFWLLYINKTNGWLPILANSLFLYLSFPLTLILNAIIKRKYFSFVLSLLLIEWLHFNWTFAWPWLTIGNVFGSHPIFIEWYRYTSVLGGSFWVLISNLLIYKKVNLKFTISFILIPILSSLFLYHFTIINYPKSINTILSQPNFKLSDSLNDGEKISQLTKKTIQIVANNNIPSIIIYPELCLSDEYWKETFSESSSYIKLNQLLKTSFPSSTILIGARLNLLSHTNQNNNNEQIKRLGNINFTNYNVAIIIDSTNKVTFKSKKKFIPKTEYWPTFFNQLFPDPNSCNYSIANDPNVISVNRHKILIAICYESIFANYCSVASENKVALIVIMASESFLQGNKAAIEQYLNISKIRAIENQKYVIKCSNEGVSAIINPLGEITTRLSSEKEGYIYVKIPIK